MPLRHLSIPLRPVASVIALLLLSVVSDAAPGKADLLVNMSGFRNDKGKVAVTVFDKKHAKDFPKKRSGALRRVVVKVKKRHAKVSLKGLPYGVYAVAVLHDENGNDKLDRKWWGPPDEGTGASRNPKSFMGPPSFKDAAFKLSKRKSAIGIRMHYW